MATSPRAAAAEAPYPIFFNRRELRTTDVEIKTLYCEIFHSDIHSIQKWGQEFPLVTDTGASVRRFKKGDRVLIGTIVDSCRKCPPCLAKMEPYSREYPTLTYDGVDKIAGTCSLGIPVEFDFSPVMLTLGRRRFTSSGVGGTADTLEMLEFCARHGIMPDIEIVKLAQINEAFRRLEKGDVRYRFVLDLQT